MFLVTSVSPVVENVYFERASLNSVSLSSFHVLLTRAFSDESLSHTAKQAHPSPIANQQGRLPRGDLLRQYSCMSWPQSSASTSEQSIVRASFGCREEELEEMAVKPGRRFIASMRSRHRVGIAGGCCAVLCSLLALSPLPVADAALTAAIQAPYLFVDSTSNEMCGHQGFNITNTGVSAVNVLYMTLGSFTGGYISLGSTQSPVIKVGALAAGSTAFVFAYLCESQHAPVAITVLVRGVRMCQRRTGTGSGKSRTRRRRSVPSGCEIRSR